MTERPRGFTKLSFGSDLRRLFGFGRGAHDTRSAEVRNCLEEWPTSSQPKQKIIVCRLCSITYSSVRLNDGKITILFFSMGDRSYLPLIASIPAARTLLLGHAE